MEDHLQALGLLIGKWGWNSKFIFLRLPLTTVLRVSIFPASITWTVFYLGAFSVCDTSTYPVIPLSLILLL